jgi:hypothetical protein
VVCVVAKAPPSLIDLIAEAGAKERTAQADLRSLVPLAKLKGYTWKQIGDALGVTAQSTQQRYGRLVDA